MNTQISEFTKQYVEDLLAFFEVNADVDVAVEAGVVEIVVPDTDSNSVLIGRNGETLRSIQYILSSVLRNTYPEVTRVNIDIAEYKKQRAEKLAIRAREWIEEVRQTGDSHVAHLGAADRRIVHQVATEYEDIQTFSEGDGRERHIVIVQKSS